VSLNYRRKRPTGSATLFVTFMLGMAIGFTLCYAVLQLGRSEGAPGPDVQPPTVVLISNGDRPAPEPEPEPAPESQTEPAPEPEPAAPPEQALPPVWPARHLFIGISGTTLDADTADLLRVFRPGGVVLRAENIENADQTRALVAAIRDAASGTEDAPPLIAAFQRGGDENPLLLEEAPTPRDLAAVQDAAAIREAARRMAEACRDRDMDLVFAPPLDAYVEGISPPELEARTFAADDATITRVAGECLTGFEEAGVAACAVHYPGLGGAVRDETGLLVVREEDLEALEAMIRPFDEAVQRGVPALLVSHVAVPAIESAVAPIPASCSPKLVRMLLREKRHFGGVLIADDLSRPEALGARAHEVALVETLAAGCDAAILIDATRDRLSAACEAVVAAVAFGTLTEEALRASSDRLDALRARVPRVVAPPGTEAVQHRIAQGDTLSSIATQYGVSIDDLRRWNQIDDPSLIKFGQELTVYVKPTTGAPEPVVEQPPEPVEAEQVEEGRPAVEAGGAVPASAGMRPAATEEPPTETAVETPPVPVPEETPPEPVEVEQVEEGRPAVEAGGAVPASAGMRPATTEVASPATTETQAPDTVPSPNTQHRVYRVAPGDTLAGIAEQYGVSTEELARWNTLEGETPLPGTLIDVYLPVAEPSNGTTFEEYRVAPGDTLHNIATRFGTTVPQLLKHNKLSNPNILIEGQRIKIPRSP